MPLSQEPYGCTRVDITNYDATLQADMVDIRLITVNPRVTPSHEEGRKCFI